MNIIIKDKETKLTKFDLVACRCNSCGHYNTELQFSSLIYPEIVNVSLVIKCKDCSNEETLFETE